MTAADTQDVGWTESASEYVTRESETVDLGIGLYHTTCPECGGGLYWELKPDPDEAGWVTNCCGHDFEMSIETVSMTQYATDSSSA